MLVAIEVDAIPLARHEKTGFVVALDSFGKLCAANVKYLSLHLGPIVQARQFVVDPVALDVNHGFMFHLCKGDALASGDENAVPCLIVS